MNHPLNHPLHVPFHGAFMSHCVLLRQAITGLMVPIAAPLSEADLSIFDQDHAEHLVSLAKLIDAAYHSEPCGHETEGIDNG